MYITGRTRHVRHYNVYMYILDQSGEINQFLPVMYRQCFSETIRAKDLKFSMRRQNVIKEFFKNFSRTLPIASQVGSKKEKCELETESLHNKSVKRAKQNCIIIFPKNTPKS